MRRSAMRRLASIAFLACIGFGVPLPAQELPPQDMPAQNLAVDLELILAVDVSDSIDEREARLQREGYIAAMADPEIRSEEHTSELQSLMRISYAVFCLKKTQIQKRTKERTYRI